MLRRDDAPRRGMRIPSLRQCRSKLEDLPVVLARDLLQLKHPVSFSTAEPTEPQGGY